MSDMREYIDKTKQFLNESLPTRRLDQMSEKEREEHLEAEKKFHQKHFVDNVTFQFEAKTRHGLIDATFKGKSLVDTAETEDIESAIRESIQHQLQREFPNHKFNDVARQSAL